MTIIQDSFFQSPAYFCERCGRSLSNKISMLAHKGPVCRAKSGAKEMSKEDREFSDQHDDTPVSDGFVFYRRPALPTTSGVFTNVPHLVVHHSPDGFEFGYGGSGPADAALNMVECVLHRMGYTGPRTKCFNGDCFQVAFVIHQKAKAKFIVPLARDEYNVIPYGMVEEWVQQNI